MLALSLRDAQQAQAHSGVANQHAAAEASSLKNSLVPQNMQRMSSQCVPAVFVFSLSVCRLLQFSLFCSDC